MDDDVSRPLNQRDRLSGPSDRDIEENGYRVWMDDTGQKLSGVHSRYDCLGRPCVIHRPSDHYMSTWPRRWNPEIRRMDRLCVHGHEHPDPDDAEFWLQHIGMDKSEHDCDGCCHGDA